MTIPGLTPQDMEDVNGVFDELPQVRRVWLFGSRARGTNKRGSDVDLALEGPGVGFETVREASFLLNEETNLPYRFDIVSKSLISSAELLDHIHRVGVLVLDRGEQP